MAVVVDGITGSGSAVACLQLAPKHAMTNAMADDAHLRALELAQEGDWEGAHRIVSGLTTKMAARIHAHLHRVEGDLSNARYWYGQAGVAPETGTLEAEWEKLVTSAKSSS